MDVPLEGIIHDRLYAPCGELNAFLPGSMPRSLSSEVNIAFAASSAIMVSYRPPFAATSAEVLRADDLGKLPNLQPADESNMES